MSHQNNQQNQDPLLRQINRIAKVGTQFAAKQAGRVMSKLGKQALLFLFKKGMIATGVFLKAVLAKIALWTAPVWLTLVAFLLLAFAVYALVYALPRMAVEDADALNVSADEVITTFFGTSMVDQDTHEGENYDYEGIYDEYETIAEKWDEGLDEDQRQQALPYALPWPVLAAVDRVRADPFIHDESLGFDTGDLVVVIGEGRDRPHLEIDRRGGSRGVNLFPLLEMIPVYQVNAARYGVAWEHLAAIHYEETNYWIRSTSDGRSPKSYVGARGPMQFMPCTWVGWGAPNCSSLNDSALFSLNNIATYRGAGIDAQGKGFADIDNELDAVAAAANYLNTVGYQSNPGLAITRYECNSCSYPNARPYAFNVLRSGAAIQMAYAQAIDQGLIEEVPLDDALADDDFDWSDYFEGGGDLTLELGSLITPRPDITFEQLRPKFSWRSSEVVHRWEQRVCRTQTVDGESVETCSWEPREKREERKLLSSAETYEGRYHHFYESTVQTVNSGSSNRRNERILSEEQVNVEGPDEEDYMKPFFDVLENNGVYLDLDVIWVMELLEMFEDYYVPEGPGTDIYDPDVVSEIEGSENWFWPVPTSNRVTSCFGYRNVSTGSTYHEGLDVGAPTPGQTGVRVHAIESGVVTESGFHSAMGNYVRIRHDTFDSRYLHFASSPAVSVGDSITRGQFIGIMGMTGSSTGIHLHLDIYINGARQDPLRYWDTTHLAITGSNCGAYR